MSPDEPYLWNHLAYHLVQAGRTAELRELFADDRWLQARVPHDGYIYDGYIADLMAAWQLAHAEVRFYLRNVAAGLPTVCASP